MESGAASAEGRVQFAGCLAFVPPLCQNDLAAQSIPVDGCTLSQWMPQRAATSRSRQSGTLAARGNTAWLTIRAASKRRSSSAAARSRSFISETVSNHVRMLFVPASRRLPRGSPIEGIRTPSRISPTPPEPFWVPARSTASSSTNAVVQNLHLPPMRHGARTVPIRSASGRSGHCQGWGYPDSEAALDQLVERRVANRAANLLGQGDEGRGDQQEDLAARRHSRPKPNRHVHPG